MLRLFFALCPDRSGREAVATLALEIADRVEGRATRTDTIHLTLAFVGDTAPDRVLNLAAIGEAVARGTRPFTLTLGLVGGFRDARVAWLGAEPVPEALAALAAPLRARLAAEGFRVDRRPFAAHVTLARKCRRIPQRESVAPIGWDVDRLSLVASELSSGGSRYRTVGEWPLAAAG